MSAKDPVLERILAQLGEFGPYQLRQHLLHLMAAFLAGIHMLALTFTAAIPEHRCFIPGLDDQDNGDDVSKYIPKDKNGRFESCLKFSPDNSTTESCGGRYHFDTTYYPTSRVIEWRLVCDKRLMHTLLQSVYMFGVLLGAVSLGTLSDKFGRKPIFYISVILQLLFGLACAFIPSYYLYAFCLFFYGAFGSGGALVTGFVLSMEVVGASMRTICGTAFNFTFALGVMIVAFWAWLIPNAQLLQIIYAGHSLLLLAHWWLMDESIEWLWNKGHKRAALTIAQKAVEINGRYFIRDAKMDQATKVEPTESCASSNSSDSSDDLLNKLPNVGLVNVFRHPHLRHRVLIMAFAWFANSLVYYGLSFSIGGLPGNPFLMSFLNGLAELPAYVINIILLDRCGRRSLESLFCFIGGFACVIVAYIPQGPIVITMSMLAKVAIASSFSICYNYAAELFPTSVRNSVVGVTTMAARGAGMIAPGIILLNSVARGLPSVIFGAMAMISAFLSLFLPETLNTEMPQTIEDGEKFGVGDTAFHTLWRCLRRGRRRRS